MARVQSCANQMWHIGRISQYVVCHVVQRDISAILSDRAEIAFILALFHWLKQPMNKIMARAYVVFGYIYTMYFFVDVVS